VPACVPRPLLLSLHLRSQMLEVVPSLQAARDDDLPSHRSAGRSRPGVAGCRQGCRHGPAPLRLMSRVRRRLWSWLTLSGTHRHAGCGGDCAAAGGAAAEPLSALEVDARGKPITAEARTHRDRYRARCPGCSINFCAGCLEQVRGAEGRGCGLGGGVGRGGEGVRAHGCLGGLWDWWNGVGWGGVGWGGGGGGGGVGWVDGWGLGGGWVGGRVCVAGWVVGCVWGVCMGVCGVCARVCARVCDVLWGVCTGVRACV
jgi:hypothetical protein